MTYLFCQGHLHIASIDPLTLECGQHFGSGAVNYAREQGAHRGLRPKLVVRSAWGVSAREVSSEIAHRSRLHCEIWRLSKLAVARPRKSSYRKAVIDKQH